MSTQASSPSSLLSQNRPTHLVPPPQCVETYPSLTTTARLNPRRKQRTSESNLPATHTLSPPHPSDLHVDHFLTFIISQDANTVIPGSFFFPSSASSSDISAVPSTSSGMSYLNIRPTSAWSDDQAPGGHIPLRDQQTITEGCQSILRGSSEGFVGIAMDKSKWQVS
jgi:hypothetical protein